MAVINSCYSNLIEGNNTLPHKQERGALIQFVYVRSIAYRDAGSKKVFNRLVQVALITFKPQDIILNNLSAMAR